MRTTKRFTPRLLRRWRDAGRGVGRLADYTPWHQVTRGDPASKGRSHLLTWQGTERLSHLLSDGELIAFYFATMLPGVVDIREQFPLSIDEGGHELGLYFAEYLSGTFPGTNKIAADLSVKHPRLKIKEDAEPWNPSTDLLITRCVSGVWSLLAVSVKPDANSLSDRDKQLLQLEQHYWQARRVQWILLTSHEYDQRVGKCLQRTAPWVISDQQVTGTDIAICTAVATDLDGYPLTTVLEAIASALSATLAWSQYVFWQTVWRGQLPVDLRRGWRAEEPIQLLTPHQFNDLNPLVSGRSAC